MASSSSSWLFVGLPPPPSPEVLRNMGEERRQLARRLWLQGSRQIAMMPMSRWAIAIQVAVENVACGPWLHVTRCWLRITARALAANLSYTMGQYYPEGLMPHALIGLLRRRCNH